MSGADFPSIYHYDATTGALTERPLVVDPDATPDTPHDCDDNAVPYVSDGALGHGWECGVCGAFLQAG